MHLQPHQWILGVVAALITGISKTGVPGVGILAVSFLAYAFGGRLSIGILLPMLIISDCFAVAWYRRHAQWDKLIGLFPWIIAGMIVGTVTLEATGGTKKDALGLMISILVLIMLAIHLLQGKLGDKLTPKSRAGIAFTGSSAGFATTVSNAAGPIMTIYLAAQKMPKKEFMGTIAWYFFIINLSKLPIYLWMTHQHPDEPIMTLSSLSFNLAMLPAILVGVFVGKWILPRISQRAFIDIVLILAAVSSLFVMFNYFR